MLSCSMGMAEGIIPVQIYIIIENFHVHRNLSRARIQIFHGNCEIVSWLQVRVCRANPKACAPIRSIRQRVEKLTDVSSSRTRTPTLEKQRFGNSSREQERTRLSTVHTKKARKFRFTYCHRTPRTARFHLFALNTAA